MKVISYIFMIIFFIVIISIRSDGLVLKIDSNDRNLFLKKNIIISIIASFYSAGIGTEGLPDRVNYIYSFIIRYQNNYSLIEIIDKFDEFGYAYLNLLISEITSSSFWFFFIITLIITFINLEIISKLTSKYKMMIILYFSSLFFFNSTFLFRQALAVSIGNIAILYLFKNKNVKFITLSLLAVTFHSSAIILFFIGIIYIFRHSKFLPPVIIFMLILAFLMFESTFNFLISSSSGTEKYTKYDLSSERSSFATILKGIPYYIMTLIALIKRKPILAQKDRNGFLILSSVMYSSSIILSYNFYWFFRVGYYFLMPTLLLIPTIEDSLNSNKDKLLFKFIMITSLGIITLRQITITLYSLK